MMKVRSDKCRLLFDIINKQEIKIDKIYIEQWIRVNTKSNCRSYKLSFNPSRPVHFWKLYWNNSSVKFLFSHFLVGPQ